MSIDKIVQVLKHSGEDTAAWDLIRTLHSGPDQRRVCGDRKSGGAVVFCERVQESDR
jgi:hypothetical protein